MLNFRYLTKSDILLNFAEARQLFNVSNNVPKVALNCNVMGRIDNFLSFKSHILASLGRLFRSFVQFVRI